MEGYFNSLHAAGISPNPEWIKRGEGRFDFGYKAAMELLDLPSARQPTALIALNDLMAIGAMQAVRECGLEVGTEFAIAGFDDFPMVQYLDPPLTSIRQPVWEVGQQIISMLLEYLELGKPPVSSEILVMPQLIVRASTGNQNRAIIDQAVLQGGEL
jgi:DNA-binding LacI/PurR family transcriptional regulator